MGGGEVCLEGYEGEGDIGRMEESGYCSKRLVIASPMGEGGKIDIVV
jgi:hypothetical protein